MSEDSVPSMHVMTKVRPRILVRQLALKADHILRPADTVTFTAIATDGRFAC